MHVFVKLTVGVFFTLIVLVNLCHSIKHFMPQHTGKKLLGNKTLLKQIENLLQQPAPLTLSKLMGAESPFGFFAPEVGNQYVLNFQLYNHHGKLLSKLGTPNLQQQESLHRYANFSTQFSKLRRKRHATRADSMQTYYVQDIAGSLATHLTKADPLVNKVHVRVMLYTYPGIHNLRLTAHQTAAPKYYLLYQKTVHFPSITAYD